MEGNFVSQWQSAVSSVLVKTSLYNIMQTIRVTFRRFIRIRWRNRLCGFQINKFGGLTLRCFLQRNFTFLGNIWQKYLSSSDCSCSIHIRKNQRVLQTFRTGFSCTVFELPRYETYQLQTRYRLRYYVPPKYLLKVVTCECLELILRKTQS